MGLQPDIIVAYTISATEESASISFLGREKRCGLWKAAWG